MQVQESTEREANLKKMNENIMNVLNKQDSPNKNKSLELQIDENHPKV